MKSFKKVFSALITPFKDSEIDYNSFRKLIEHQLRDGIQGFVINGTTAESPTLTDSEVEKLFKIAKEMVPPNITLLLGTGSNSTLKAIKDSKNAERLGAHGALVVVPYYNKPPQRGLFEHFKAIADATQIPVILYNVPGRTITGLEIETIKKLSEHPNIYGIKEASGNILFDKQIKIQCGDEFILLSGDDGTYEEFLEIGGHGCISVASMVIPKVILEGKTKQHKGTIDTLFIESNPIPVKYALYALGIIASPECRLPLVTLSANNQEKVRNCLKEEGLL